MNPHLPPWIRAPLFRLLRRGFRLLPLSVARRDRLRQRFLDRYGALVPDPPRGHVRVHASPSPHRPGERATEPAIGYVADRDAALPDPLPATLVAFYLPQFHPIPENDAWWGEGFTEWHNVARALPQFEGHAQPRLPGALGFYDLRVADVMRRQMALARRYGIGALCFYHYWFSGKTLLDTPARQWLDDPSLDLPICLCWANESWSRRWDGRTGETLIAQVHDPEDDLAFIAAIAPWLRDQRYLRVGGKPLLLVYRTGLLPDPVTTAKRWRDWCRDHDVGEIFLACVHGFERTDPRTIGFDAAVEFPPNMATPKSITAHQSLLNPGYRGEVLDWRELASDYASRAMPDYPLFPAVNPGWDNEPRRSGRGRVYAHASPRGYRDWLQATLIHRASRLPHDHRLVFVNAWNEWAEGAVLEPDARLGFAWLEATRQALVRTAGRESPRTTRPCAVVHAWYPEVLGELLDALAASGVDWRILVTTAPEKEAAVRACLARHAPDAGLEIHPNRGRDVLPFLHVANRLLDEGVEVVLKLHTKRSSHRRDGERWRRDLIERLLAPARAPILAQRLADDPRLGLVAPEGHVQPLDYYWGANRDNVHRLAALLGIPEPDAGRDRFVAGNMFWLRLEALRPLLDAHLDPWRFEPEQGQVDGSFAHAIERIIALAVRAAGYRMDTAAQLCGETEAEGSYPYARRDPGS